MPCRATCHVGLVLHVMRVPTCHVGLDVVLVVDMRDR